MCRRRCGAASPRSASARWWIGGTPNRRNCMSRCNASPKPSAPTSVCCGRPARAIHTISAPSQTTSRTLVALEDWNRLMDHVLSYNFNEIEYTVRQEIHGTSARLNAALDELRSHIAPLQQVWTREAAEAYRIEQAGWDQ